MPADERGDGRVGSASYSAADRAARTAYGRLLAWLSCRTGDMAGAEDALADAFAAALTSWPERGVPDAPDAWLLQVARRKLTDRARRAQTRRTHEPDLVRLFEDLAMTETPDAIGDQRLSLLFTCAHPAIDPAVRTPLMLQTVLGLDAAHIARVFVVAPKTMAQRLVRAKRKIKAAGIPFDLPDRSDWPARMDAVLSAIYAAYTAGWDGSGPVGDAGDRLVDEAEWLARLLSEWVSDHAEAHGLLALILYCESRRPARTGTYTPLSEQDTSLWDHRMIDEAETCLRTAAGLGAPGRFQFEAAIQSVHAERRHSGETNWQALLRIYDALIAQNPALGAWVARAAVIMEADEPKAALDALDALPQDRAVAYGPYWATRAHCLQRAGRLEEAVAAYDRAIALTDDGSARSYLQSRRVRLVN
ncbi:MAG: DUF6596 domain-containing protein [Pseudomonadota bacterium]